MNSIADAIFEASRNRGSIPIAVVERQESLPESVILTLPICRMKRFGADANFSFEIKGGYLSKHAEIP